MNEVMHAWFSRKHCEKNGYVIYLDAKGKQVVCSFVTREKTHTHNFDDIEYRGEVVEWHSSPSVDWSELGFMLQEIG